MDASFTHVPSYHSFLLLPQLLPAIASQLPLSTPAFASPLLPLFFQQSEPNLRSRLEGKDARIYKPHCPPNGNVLQDSMPRRIQAEPGERTISQTSNQSDKVLYSPLCAFVFSLNAYTLCTQWDGEGAARRPAPFTLQRVNIS